MFGIWFDTTLDKKYFRFIINDVEVYCGKDYNVYLWECNSEFEYNWESLSQKSKRTI